MLAYYLIDNPVEVTNIVKGLSEKPSNVLVGSVSFAEYTQSATCQHSLINRVS